MVIKGFKQIGVKNRTTKVNAISLDHPDTDIN